MVTNSLMLTFETELEFSSKTGLRILKGVASLSENKLQILF